MVRDDRAAYPMQIWFRLRLGGRLDRAALEHAWRQALFAHPLLTSVAKDFHGRLHWEGIQHLSELSPTQAEVVWLPPGALDELAAKRPISIIQEPGARLFAASGEEETTLLVVFHHAATDGLGGCGFLSDLLQNYGEQARQQRVPQRAGAKLPGRGNFGLSRLQLAQQAPWLLAGISNGLRFALHPATRLTRQSGEARSLSSGYAPGLCRHLFSAAATTAIRRAARERNVTLNDLLLCELLQAIAAWQSERGEFDPAGRLRVNVPINMRTADDALLPAANVVSMLFLERRGAACAAGGEALLAGIQAQMNRNKRFRLGLIFPLVLELVRKLGRLPSMATEERCRTTCVLTNLVEPLRDWPGPKDAIGRIVAGGLTLESFEMYAPIRPQTQAAFTALSYGGCLNLLLHYDCGAIAAPAAVDLLRRFAEGVKGATD